MTGRSGRSEPDRWVSVPPSYAVSCRRIGIDVPPDRLLAATALAGTVLAVGGTVLTLLATSGWHVVGGTLLLCGGVGLVLTGRYGVVLAARASRGRALGTSPALVAALTLGMSLWPATERAVEFAVDAGRGPLVTRLDRDRRRAAGTPRTGLRRFAERWDDRFPPLARACTLVDRAAAAPPAERADLLDSARERIRRGVADELSRFAADLQGPVTGLYAFGVLLPLAMVSLLPAASAAGLPVTGVGLAVLYGILLPGCLVAAAAWLLGQRPVAFPPEPVPRSHPDVSSRRWPPLFGGVAAAAAAWWVAGSLFASWTAPIAAGGGGIGTALVIRYRRTRAVRAEVRAIERGLPTAMSAIGRRLDRGQSAEAALAAARDDVPPPVDDLLAGAATRQRVLGVGIEAAFTGHGGVLETIPSSRARGAATLLGAAAEIGPPAGETVAAMGDHLDALQDLERRLRRDLSRVTGTLSNTAALFGPLVGGVTVALAGRLRGSEQLGAVEPAVLGPAVGWYVLVLAVVLTGLAAGLERGLDRALIGYRSGLALLSGTATYLAALFATSALV